MKDFDELIQTDAQSDICVFAYNTTNLGDYIQSLAILQHVTPRRFVLRDHIRGAGDSLLVGNAWLSHGPLPRPEQFLGIRYVGIHLEDTLRRSENASFFSTCGTVGCRDTQTYEFLIENGVPSVLTRCPTLTFPTYNGPREGIVCVDVQDKVAVRAHKRFAPREPLLRMTHDFSWLATNCIEDGSFHNRLRDAYNALSVYRRASLVVTSRIHVALPSIAFGTPVLFVGRRDSRYGVFDSLDLNEGWERLRWFRVLPNPLHKPLKALDSGRVKMEYLSAFNTILADVGGLRGIRSAPEALHH